MGYHGVGRLERRLGGCQRVPDGCQIRRTRLGANGVEVVEDGVDAPIRALKSVVPGFRALPQILSDPVLGPDHACAALNLWYRHDHVHDLEKRGHDEEKGENLAETPLRFAAVDQLPVGVDRELDADDEEEVDDPLDDHRDAVEAAKRIRGGNDHEDEIDDADGDDGEDRSVEERDRCDRVECDRGDAQSVTGGGQGRREHVDGHVLRTSAKLGIKSVGVGPDEYAEAAHGAELERDEQDGRYLPRSRGPPGPHPLVPASLPLAVDRGYDADDDRVRYEDPAEMENDEPVVDAELALGGLCDGGEEQGTRGDEHVRVALLQQLLLARVDVAIEDEDEGGDEEEEGLEVRREADADACDGWDRGEAQRIRRAGEGG